MVRLRSAGAASMAALLIDAVDTLLAHVEYSLPARALLDESAHVATALLFLGALWSCPARPFVLGTVLGSVIIDVDHMPMSIEHYGDLAGLARPDTHSLLTAVLAAGLAR